MTGRRCAPLLLGFFLAALPPGEHAAAQSRWIQREFILGTFWDPPTDAAAKNLARDSARFAMARSAHFNLLTGMQIEPGIDRSFEGMVWALTVARSVGLQYLVTDRRFFPAYEHRFDPGLGAAVVADYRRLPDSLRQFMMGYNLCDEPQFDQTHLRNVSDWKWFLEGADPGKLVYANLVGSYAPAYRWGGFTGKRTDGILDADGKKEYESYLTLYVDSLRPPVVSFDHYPFFRNGTMRHDYFYNLEIIRARAAGKPFWAYPMTVDHLTYADPTEAQLNFMYLCPVAYGAKGLVDFCFWTPGPGDDYRLSLIDREGMPTAKYPLVRRLNIFLQRFLGPIVMTSTHVGVFHSSDFPGPQQWMSRTLGRVQEVIAAVSDPKVLVGVFRQSTTVFLLLVNKSVDPIGPGTIELRGVASAAAIGPRIAGFEHAAGVRFTGITLSLKTRQGTSTVFVPALTGGEGVIIRLSRFVSSAGGG